MAPGDGFFRRSLNADKPGSDADFGSGSQAALQDSSACVRSTSKSGNSASQFPELEVKRT